MRSFLYFAYGSNMLSARLRERTPSAARVATAELHAHALRWHKQGADGSGKCDVVPVADAGARVHGVLYRIASDEQHHLDTAESLGVGYVDRTLTVHVGAQPRQARLYVALRTDPDLLPFDWYRALVLAGAREHALPADYLGRLEAVAARPDADAGRSRRHFALIDAASMAPPVR